MKRLLKMNFQPLDHTSSILNDHLTANIWKLTDGGRNRVLVLAFRLNH